MTKKKRRARRANKRANQFKTHALAEGVRDATNRGNGPSNLEAISEIENVLIWIFHSAKGQVRQFSYCDIMSMWEYLDHNRRVDLDYIRSIY